MNTPMDMSQEQLMDLLDIATDALEEIAESTRNGVAHEALEAIAHKTMEFMEAT